MPAPGDIWMITARGSAFGQTILNTFFYSLTTVTGTPTDLAVATEFANQVKGGPGGVDQLETKLLTLLPAVYTLNEWWVQKIKPNRLRKGITPRNTPGLNVGVCNASNQAAVITRVCEFSGRAFVGGLHVGPIPQDAPTQINGLIAAAYVTKLQTMATAMVAPINGTIAATFTALPCLYHRKTANVTPLSSAFPQATLRVMRRRTLGLGE